MAERQAGRWGGFREGAGLPGVFAPLLVDARRAASRRAPPASLTSTNAIPHCEALNPGLIVGGHRQPQQQVSVSVRDEERQVSLVAYRGGLLPRLARYIPPVLVSTGSAEGECRPAESPVGIDLGRAGDLKGERRLRRLPRLARLARLRSRQWPIGCDRGLAPDQQHGVCVGA